MDRIQEAIAKARAERQGKIGRQEQQDNSVGGPLGEQTSLWEEPSSPSAGHAANISYTTTRNVTLNEEMLLENRVIADQEDDERVEPYRQLRTQLLKMFRDNGWNTLAITSAHENAGKTLTAVNLAISMSHELNQTVLLVDVDLRRPSVHETMGFSVDKGIVDVLRGEVKLHEALVHPSLERLVVLPGKALGKFSSEVLSSPAMASLLEDIRTRYESRIIIFDLPPVLRNDDALLFAPMVDATLLVVEAGATTEDDIQDSVRLLEGSNLIGSILNKAK